MIQTKQDLKEYLSADMKFYSSYNKKDKLIFRICQDSFYYIYKYIKFLRKEEYYANIHSSKFNTLMCLWYYKRKNKLGNKLGFRIPRNTFGPGLEIYHHGEVIVNEGARIGANAKLHGGNCIGNNGKIDLAPQIGDYLNLGIGAKIIGKVNLGNNIRVGANAVVTKSFDGDSLTLVGIPAHSKNTKI